MPLLRHGTSATARDHRASGVGTKRISDKLCMWQETDHHALSVSWSMHSRKVRGEVWRTRELSELDSGTRPSCLCAEVSALSQCFCKRGIVSTSTARCVLTGLCLPVLVRSGSSELSGLCTVSYGRVVARELGTAARTISDNMHSRRPFGRLGSIRFDSVSCSPPTTLSTTLRFPRRSQAVTAHAK